MKKKILYFLLFFVFLFFPKKTLAYQQTEAVCYSQCAAYKFYWKGDFCWDLFINQCSISSKDMVKNAISLVKDTVQAMATGKLMTIVDISQVFKANFVCKPLIDCIVPRLNDCESTCKDISQTYYAPNLSVGNPYGSIAYQNVYYDKDRHQLVFKVINNGGYAWDIDVSASWGHTRNRDKIVSGGGTLFTEKIPELVFFGARVGSPKTPGDYVTDFLIDESNFSGFLSRFKSDADNHYIPPAWYKTVPFIAPDGEYTKVILNVDPNQMIPESSEGDNTYILEIDDLPTPVSLTVEKLTYRRTNPMSLTEYMVNFELKNSGEESGDAHVKWYEGNYESGKSPIHEQNMVVQGLNKVSFDHLLNVDVSSGGDSCNYSQKYTLVVFDDEGFIKTRHEFSLPKFAGSISGRVEDLFGKKVVGATITTSAGQTATVNDMGYYHIKGIPTLGKITLTATHPEFSQTETKEVEIKFDDSFDKCHPEGLALDGINFVLKDQDVMFTVTIKDGLGNPIMAKILAFNSDWRFNETVNGNGPLPGMQPGKYTFTISALGYKTISQDVNAVPNNQNLEFTLEKFNGRPDDSGLHLIAPKLLWKKTLGSGERIISNMSGSKNGNLLVIYAVDNKAKNSNLFFLDLLTGRQIKEASAPYALGYEGFVGLDTSYDGETVGLNTNLGIKKDNERILKIFNSSGNETGSTTLSKGTGGWATSMDVSPDGFYLCPGELFNKGLHKYTRYETEGKMDYKRGSTTSADCGKHFLRNNNIVTSCKGKQEGYCEETLAKQQVRIIGDTDEGGSSTSTLFDSAFNDTTTVVRTFKKLYYFGQSNWNKELKSDNMYKSVAVSPGGMYTLVTEGSGASLKLKIFGNTGGDKTPDFPYEDVKFVFANDKGLFFASVVLNRLNFYQIGEYQNEYKSEETTKETGLETTSDLSRLSGDTFVPAGEVSFSTITPGLIYRAERNLQLKYLNPAGTLSILEGTIFSKEYNHRPVLLKGQLAAEFGSPMTVYAIKFDRYGLSLFQSKLSQFIAGTLAEGEYFIVQNIHTKFTVKNSPNQVLVAVANGEVQVKGGKTERTVTSGKQITIDAKNEIKESIYIGSKIKAIILGIVVLILSVVLFIYRKTKVGSKIIEILKKTAVYIWKYLKILIKWFWLIIKVVIIFIRKMVKKGTPILWKAIKKGGQNLMVIIRTISKKDK